MTLGGHGHVPHKPADQQTGNIKCCRTAAEKRADREMVCRGFDYVSRSVLNPGRLHRQCLPLASRRASAGQQTGPSVRVSSAGTHALVGHSISEPMAALLLDSGVEPDSFEARRLSEQMLKEADLVLAMTRAQRGLVVELWPAAVRRTFTLREFARLLSWVDPSALPAGTPAERLRAAIPLAAAERGRERTPPTRTTLWIRFDSATRCMPTRLSRWRPR